MPDGCTGFKTVCQGASLCIILLVSNANGKKLKENVCTLEHASKNGTPSILNTGDHKIVLYRFSMSLSILYDSFFG